MPQEDYLKYWRVIRYYILRKNNLKPAELETLIFLRSEKYFTKNDLINLQKCTPGTVDALMIYFQMGGLKCSQNQRLIPGKRNSKQYTNYLKNQNE